MRKKSIGKIVGENPIEARTLSNMHKRCTDAALHNYHRYGGRGLRVCHRWRYTEKGLRNFISDLGKRPDGSSIERIDNDVGYTCGKCKECREKGWPENCRWASAKEQARNRSSSRVISRGDESRTLAEWAEMTGIHPTVISYRIDQLGWTIEDALSRKEDGRVRTLTALGKTRTLKEWSKITGISAAQLSNRLQQGWSPKRTVTSPLGERLPEQFLSYAGERLPIRDWVKRTGLSDNTIRGRIKLGWSAKDVLTKPNRSKRRK